MMPNRSLHDSIAADPHGTPIYWLNLPLLAERAAQVLQALPDQALPQLLEQALQEQHYNLPVVLEPSPPLFWSFF